MIKIKLHVLLKLSVIVLIGCMSNKQQVKKQDQELSKKSNTASSFNATFYTVRDYTVTPTCNPDFPDYTNPNYQTANNAGNENNLGPFSTVMSFCTAEPSAEGTPYGGGHGKFIFENGDELHFKIDHGVVKPIVNPTSIYDLYFKDPFYFIGGTGQFKNASGEGMTNSLVNLFDDNGAVIAEHRTEHVWTGTLTLN